MCIRDRGANTTGINSGGGGGGGGGFFGGGGGGATTADDAAGGGGGGSGFTPDGTGLTQGGQTDGDGQVIISWQVGQGCAAPATPAAIAVPAVAVPAEPGFTG